MSKLLYQGHKEDLLYLSTQMTRLYSTFSYLVLALNAKMLVFRGPCGHPGDMPTGDKLYHKEELAKIKTLNSSQTIGK